MLFARFVKTLFYSVIVIPAKAGIQSNQSVLGSRLRGSDGISRFSQDHLAWVDRNLNLAYCFEFRASDFEF
jgi:hypothetical protein